MEKIKNFYWEDMDGYKFDPEDKDNNYMFFLKMGLLDHVAEDYDRHRLCEIYTEMLSEYPDSICMTLNEVLDMLGKMDCHKPSSNVVVMRCPLAPPFNEHPDYMFGTPLDWMEINSCDTPEPPVNDTVIDTVE